MQAPSAGQKNSRRMGGGGWGTARAAGCRAGGAAQRQNFPKRGRSQAVAGRAARHGVTRAGGKPHRHSLGRQRPACPPPVPQSGQSCAARMGAPPAGVGDARRRWRAGGCGRRGSSGTCAAAALGSWTIVHCKMSQGATITTWLRSHQGRPETCGPVKLRGERALATAVGTALRHSAWKLWGPARLWLMRNSPSTSHTQRRPTRQRGQSRLVKAARHFAPECSRARN